MAPFQTTVLLMSWAVLTSAGVTRYDQTQTGDYNVHLDLKNIEVLAFLDGSALGLGEYGDYDYGEITLRPPASNTTATIFGKPSENSTDSGLPSTSPSPSSVPSSEVPSAGSTPVSGGNSTGIREGSSTESSSTEASTEGTTTKPVRRCGAGFYRDPAGRCRRLRRPIKFSGLLQQAKNRITSGK